MKKILLLAMCVPIILSAQNGITVSNLAVDAGTVTFDVSWDKDAPNMPEVWSDSVWVFVDYNKDGVMKRLPLLSGATLTATSAPDVGKVIEEENNDKGVWVVGNAKSKTNSSGSFSATVKLLTATADVSGACAYASNYPPVGEYITSQTVKFTGTPLYDLTLKGAENDTIYRTSGTDFDIPEGYALVSFTDITGAPGIMKCIPPAIYTLIASALDFCAGSEGVTFALSGTESGRDYQLYRDNLDVVGTVLNGTGDAATFTGSFADAGVYTAQVEEEGILCAAVMSGLHTVIEHLLPTITPSGGEANQSIDQNTAITTITFTAGNGATTITHSGELPNGVTGENTSTLVHTISGTPSAAGVFPYTITATGEGGCTVTTSGTITVNALTPPFAASTQTWTVGAQTWSDRIVSPADCNKSAFTFDSNSPQCRSNTYKSVLYYYYNWPYVIANKNTMCPHGWRVPEYDDCVTLDKALGGSGAQRSATASWITEHYLQLWSGSLASGYWSATHAGPQYGSDGNYWSQTADGSTNAYVLYYDLDGSVSPAYSTVRSAGFMLRCVK
jgi:uncharacterized protein (TIGR02145 family)